MSQQIRLKKFWWWINERHSIYIKRQAERPWPWTKDKILQTYKFTNVFRELDAETIKFHNCIDGLENGPNKLYNMIVFRAFNLASTYNYLNNYRRMTHTRTMKKALHRRSDKGTKIFTGAYIITNAGKSEPKIDLMADALGVMYRARTRIWDAMQEKMTMRHCTEVLSQYPMQGMFTAYEVICDMRYQKGMLDKAPDKKKWANLGPGARRGINRIVSGKKKPNVFPRTTDYEDFMLELLKSSRPSLKKYVPPLEMREIEHSLCEFDKYMRVLNNEGRPRSKYVRRDQ